MEASEKSLLEAQVQIKDLSEEVESLKQKAEDIERQRLNAETRYNELRETSKQKDARFAKETLKYEHDKKINTELRNLLENERKTMDEETDRLEDLIENLHKQHEHKIATIKSTLFMVHSTLSCSKDIIIHREQISIEDLIKKIQELAFHVSITYSLKRPSSHSPPQQTSTPASGGGFGQILSAQKDYVKYVPPTTLASDWRTRFLNQNSSNAKDQNQLSYTSPRLN